MVKLEKLLKFYKWNATHIDMDKCLQMKEKGFLQMKKHQEYPLFLLNYTSKAQYKKHWCEELIHARGLIVGEDGEIIARPLPKFFNENEITGCDVLQDQDYELYKKMDGSLAIMFHYKGKRIFCTRGSFCSDQALKAEEIFKKKYLNKDVKKECTYCFEIIYPENKIVVDYGALQDLFLISITHTKTGKNINIEQAGFTTVPKIDTSKLTVTEWSAHDTENEEGYVIRFMTDNLRMKIKFDNYVQKHRAKNSSAKAIKKSMKNMKKINLDAIPDECYDEVKEITADMEEQFRRKEKEVMKIYEDLQEENTITSDLIESIKQSPYSKILFAIHAKKQYDMLIWKSL